MVSDEEFAELRATAERYQQALEEALGFLHLNCPAHATEALRKALSSLPAPLPAPEAT